MDVIGRFVFQSHLFSQYYIGWKILWVIIRGHFTGVGDVKTTFHSEKYMSNKEEQKKPKNPGQAFFDVSKAFDNVDRPTMLFTHGIKVYRELGP